MSSVAFFCTIYISGFFIEILNLSDGTYFDFMSLTLSLSLLIFMYVMQHFNNF